MELIVKRTFSLEAYAHKSCVDAQTTTYPAVPWNGVGHVTLTDTRQVPVGATCGLCGRVIVEPTVATQIA